MNSSIVRLILLLSLIIIVMNEDAPNQPHPFCGNGRCLMCVGKYCTVTCRGEKCEACPDGQCCDGDKCNMCRGKRCCNDSNCNNCVRNCVEKCEEQSTCQNDCFQKCLPQDIAKIPSNIQRNLSFIIKKTYLPVNVTTIINVTNIIKNDQNINTPPLVFNSSTINNFTVDEDVLEKLGKGNVTLEENISKNTYGNFDLDNDQSQNDSPILKQNTKTNQKCCTIIHPKLCDTIRGICFIAKHSECSNLCHSKYLHIIKSKHNSCLIIKANPYIYCKYKLIDCTGCHECDESDCSTPKTCPNQCMSAMVPDDFYNTLLKLKTKKGSLPR